MPHNDDDEDFLPPLRKNSTVKAIIGRAALVTFSVTGGEAATAYSKDFEDGDIALRNDQAEMAIKGSNNFFLFRDDEFNKTYVDPAKVTLILELPPIDRMQEAYESFVIFEGQDKVQDEDAGLLSPFFSSLKFDEIVRRAEKTDAPVTQHLATVTLYNQEAPDEIQIHKVRFLIGTAAKPEPQAIIKVITENLTQQLKELGWGEYSDFNVTVTVEDMQPKGRLLSPPAEKPEPGKNG